MDLFEQTLFACEGHTKQNTLELRPDDAKASLDHFLQNDSLNLKTVCAYCGHTKHSAMLPACHYIDDYIVTSIDPCDKLLFCDFLCAKLYNDNRNPISINFKEYRQMYLTNKLDKTAKDVYDRCKNVLFVMLPVYKTNSTNYKLNRQKLNATI